MTKSVWHIYMVRCSDNTLYTGIAMDVNRRLEEHNSDNRLGAKYTRTRRPVQLVYQEAVNSRSEAAKREHAIRTLNKKDKELLVQQYTKKNS
jgi:putative endonuclease